MIMKKIYAIIAISAILCSCRESLVTPPPQQLMTDDEIALETMAGGELGTTMNVSASAYEDPTPAVEIAGMSDEFMYGEYFFERNFTQNTSPFKGLGPVYVRSSCMDCHPGYGYGTRTNLPAEMSDNDYADFLIWHRGLAVPAARELDNPQVQRGRQLFREIGCTACHRPSWTTDADDDAYDPNGFFQNGKRMVDGKLKQLPKYPSQVIWPYTDMIQHRLCMVNDIRTGWCRTTPLWGRGLSQLCAGHSYRLHDRRAKTVIEAIMWHGSKDSDARWTVEKFRELSKEDRDAVVAFIDAI